MISIYLPISVAIPWRWLMTRGNVCVCMCTHTDLMVYIYIYHYIYIPLYVCVYVYIIIYICIYISLYIYVCIYIYIYNELTNFSNVTKLIRVEKEFQHILDSSLELLDSHQCCLLICSFFPFLLSSYHILITFLSSEKGMVSKVGKEPSPTNRVMSIKKKKTAAE